MQVEVDKILSKKMVVNIGVPQGSVTAPTLFLIYINDMCNVSDALGMVQFADDTTLYMVGDNLTELSYRMSGEFAKIDRWLVTNRLSLNLTKTSYMEVSITTYLTIQKFLLGMLILIECLKHRFLA